MGNEFYFVAFNDLASCRYFENAMIPWTAIREYADECGLVLDDDRDMLFQIIRIVDAWYLDKQAEKAKKESKSGNRSGISAARKKNAAGGGGDKPRR